MIIIKLNLYDTKPNPCPKMMTKLKCNGMLHNPSLQKVRYDITVHL